MCVNYVYRSFLSLLESLKWNLNPSKSYFTPGSPHSAKKIQIVEKKLQGSSSAACAGAFTSALVKEVASTKDKDKHILTLKVKEQAVRIGEV